MDLNKATVVLPRFNEMLRSNLKDALEPHNLTEGLEASLAILKCFRVIAEPESQKFLYELNKHLALTLNSFYNETVQFILDSKPRKSGQLFYRSLFEEYVSDIKASKLPRRSESLGGSILANMIGDKPTVRSRGESHQTTDVDQRLLSYADRELLAIYVTRKGGVIDMVETLSIFLKVAHPL